MLVTLPAVYWWMKRGWLRYSTPKPGVHRIRAAAIKRMLQLHPDLQVRTLWRMHLWRLHREQEQEGQHDGHQQQAGRG